jgi:hypothetical protein
MKRFCTAVAGTGLLLLCSPARAEESSPSRRHGAYLEIGGSTFVGANYERMVTPRVGLRLGAGIVPVVGASTAVAMANYVTGSARHQVELGTGVLSVRESTGRWYATSTSTVGYRFRADNGFLLRAGIAIDVIDGRPSAIPGISFGRSF